MSQLEFLAKIRNDINLKDVKGVDIRFNQYSLFLAWFMMQGRIEYPNIYENVLLGDFSYLKLKNFKIGDVDFFNELEYYIWHLRPDIRRTFPIEKSSSPYDYKLWRLENTRQMSLIMIPAELEHFRKIEDLRTEINGLNSLSSGMSDTEKIVDSIQFFLSQDFEKTKLGDIYDASSMSGYRRLKPPENSKYLDGVNVIGYSQNELGIGEDARTVYYSFLDSDKKIDVSLFPLNLPGNPSFSKFFDHLPVTNSLENKVNVFTLPLVDFLQQTFIWGEALTLDKTNIVFAPWEFDKWPSDKSFCFEMIDEVWASTEYTRKAFLEFLPEQKVIKMPLPVVVNEGVSADRKRFGLDEKRYFFLYMFDFNSSITRKNPIVLINAFLKTFGESDRTGLVLKFLNFNEKDEQCREIARLIEENSSIFTVREILSSDEIHSLIKSVNCYVSPHRSEGFGRTLAEAMLLKVPVMATAFSGNLDFCVQETFIPLDFKVVPVKPGEYPLINSEGYFWADVEEDDLSKKLSFAVNQDHTKMIQKAYEHIKYYHSTSYCGKQYTERIRAILQKENT